jgi:hypothetical protein
LINTLHDQEIRLVRSTRHVTEVPDEILKARRASFDKARSHAQVCIKACNLLFITASVDCNKFSNIVKQALEKRQVDLLEVSLLSGNRCGHHFFSVIAELAFNGVAGPVYGQFLNFCSE